MVFSASIVWISPTVADRKSTRLNSSHGYISYAVFCLKKKTKQRKIVQDGQTVCQARYSSPPELRPPLEHPMEAISAKLYTKHVPSHKSRLKRGRCPGN